MHLRRLANALMTSKNKFAHDIFALLAASLDLRNGGGLIIQLPLWLLIYYVFRLIQDFVDLGELDETNKFKYTNFRSVC